MSESHLIRYVIDTKLNSIKFNRKNRDKYFECYNKNYTNAEFSLYQIYKEKLENDLQFMKYLLQNIDYEDVELTKIYDMELKEDDEGKLFHFIYIGGETCKLLKNETKTTYQDDDKAIVDIINKIMKG